MPKAIHVELSRGQSAELRDPSTLTVRQRRPFDNAVAAVQIGADSAAAVSGESVLGVADVALIVLLESWTFNLPLPTLDDQEVLDDFSTEDYDRLMIAVGEVIPRMRWTPPADHKASSRKKK